MYFATDFEEDIHPRYQGDTIRDHAPAWAFPRHVTQIEYWDENERIDRDCPRCGCSFTIPAKVFARLLDAVNHNRLVCWQCYGKRKARSQERQFRETLRYIAGQKPYLC